MQNPKVSVIIPVFKAERYIEKCVHSLYNQSLDSIEFIFVDDCSPDNSIEIVQNVLKIYPNRKNQVKLIRHQQNLGVAKARQDGIDAASGEYLIHCDPDDWIEQDMYESMYLKAKQSEADVVICDFVKEFPNTSEIKLQKPLENKSIIILEQISGRSKINIQGSLWNKLVSKKYYRKARIPSDISFCEDVYYWFQILKQEIKIEYLGRPLYHYRFNPNSIVHNNDVESLRKDMSLISKFDYLIDKSNIEQYTYCCKSFIVYICFSRLYQSQSISNKDFKRLTRKYTNYLKYNKSIKKHHLYILKLAMNGYFVYVKAIHKRLSLLLHVMHNMLSHGN